MVGQHSVAEAAARVGPDADEAGVAVAVAAHGGLEAASAHTVEQSEVVPEAWAARLSASRPH